MAGIEPVAHGNFNRVMFSSLYVIRVGSGVPADLDPPQNGPPVQIR
jgi:hypothetical protein